MRKVLVCMALVAAIAVFASGAAFAAPPDKMILKEIQKSKGPVPFDHKTHAETFKPCAVCHHKDVQGKERNCATACHEGPTLKEVFHKQCKDCHIKEKSGPVKCDGCHQKSK